MADYSLVPVEHQPDFENVSFVPVDHDPFGDSGTVQQAQAQLARQAPTQIWPAATQLEAQPQQGGTGAGQLNVNALSVGTQATVPGNSGTVQRAPMQLAQAQLPQTTPTLPTQPAPPTQLKQPHDRIAAHAMDQVGSEKWSDDVAKGFYKAGRNKCNLFVYDILTGAGASSGYPNGSWLFSYPPTAGQWADPNYPIRGWRVLGAEEAPKAGDVVAQKIDYSDASGHVMIVGPDGNHLIGTGTSAGQPHGTIVHIPPRDNLGRDGVSHGPLVFRRFGE